MGGYQSVKRFVRTLLGASSPEARVIIETRLGEQCQVDYGTGPMVRDPDSGEYRRTRLFVMTLGCSRKPVRLLTFKSSSRIWPSCMSRRFGAWAVRHELRSWTTCAKAYCRPTSTIRA